MVGAAGFEPAPLACEAISGTCPYLRVLHNALSRLQQGHTGISPYRPLLFTAPLAAVAARPAPRRSHRPYDPIIPRNLSRPVRYGGASSLACSCRANVVDELATLTGSLRNTGPAARHLVWPPGSGVGVGGVLKQWCERLGEIGDAVRRDRAADRWPLERDTGAVYDGASRATSNQTLSSSSCPSDPGALAPAAHRPTSEAVGTDATPVPSRVQVHHRRTREDDVIGAGVQIPQPPPLFWRLLAQQFKHGSVMCVLSARRSPAGGESPDGVASGWMRPDELERRLQERSASTPSGRLPAPNSSTS